ncbi:hypothetical protein [Thermogutta sp.]
MSVFLLGSVNFLGGRFFNAVADILPGFSASSYGKITAVSGTGMGLALD